jgi:hypothetical protein
MIPSDPDNGVVRNSEMTHGYFGDPADSGESRGFASPSHEGFVFLDKHEVDVFCGWVEPIDGPFAGGNHIATNKQSQIDERTGGPAAHLCPLKRGVRVSK